MRKVKRIYVPLDNDICACKTKKETLRLMEHDDFIFTTLTEFLSFKYASRLFVDVGDEFHEIKKGKCDGTDIIITEEHDIEQLLFSGAFDWYKPEVKQ